jgi:hypothetical protein
MWRTRKGTFTLALLCCVTLTSVSCGTAGTSADVQVPDPASPPKFLSDGFESGNFSKWSFVTADVAINTDPAFARTGVRSSRMHYSLCSTCGAEHQDSNRFIELDFDSRNGHPNGIQHVFVRGWVYFKTPEPGGSIAVQRKLFYIKSPSGAGGVPNYYWGVILTSDGIVATPNKVQLYLLVGNSGVGGGSTRIWTGDGPSEELAFDRWYDIQIEVRANTPGVNDGRIALWLDGRKVFENDAMNLRLDSSLAISRVEIGNQADRFDYLPVEEYRYWDELRVSDSFIP